jgi:hypothetical protein
MRWLLLLLFVSLTGATGPAGGANAGARPPMPRPAAPPGRFHRRDWAAPAGRWMNAMAAGSGTPTHSSRGDRDLDRPLRGRPRPGRWPAGMALHRGGRTARRALCGQHGARPHARRRHLPGRQGSVYQGEWQEGREQGLGLRVWATAAMRASGARASGMGAASCSGSTAISTAASSARTARGAGRVFQRRGRLVPRHLARRLLPRGRAPGGDRPAAGGMPLMGLSAAP